MTVRFGGSSDIDVIVEFNRLLALETEGKELDPELLRAGVEAGIADPEKIGYFLALDEGVILGQLAITREWSDWRNGWFWWVQSVYVRRESRQRGVFRVLFEHARAAARQAPQVIGMRLYVDNHNLAAHEVYERLGMSRIDYQLLEVYPL